MAPVTARGKKPSQQAALLIKIEIWKSALARRRAARRREQKKATQKFPYSRNFSCRKCLKCHASRDSLSLASQADSSESRGGGGRGENSTRKQKQKKGQKLRHRRRIKVVAGANDFISHLTTRADRFLEKTELKVGRKLWVVEVDSRGPSSLSLSLMFLFW